MAIFSKLGRYTSTALLLIRIGLGIMMIVHGYPKLMAGTEKWTKLGGNMSHFGIHAYPEIWGFLAAAAEGIGGVLILLGFVFRPACFFILFTMVVATTTHFYEPGAIMDHWKEASEAMELGIMFLGLFILGPGRYSIDKS